MSNELDRTRLEARLDVWGVRLRDWGLDGLVMALLEAAEPLSPLGAQALYVAQPTLKLLLPSAGVGQWARLLEDPANVAWLRSCLTQPCQDDVSDVTFPDEEGSSDGPGD
ncbi:hypothetical protein ACFLYO_03480 [Chloroflexota bacterium]